MNLKKYILGIFFIFFVAVCIIVILSLFILDLYFIDIIKMCIFTLFALFIIFLFVNIVFIERLFKPLDKAIYDINNFEFKKENSFIHKTNIREFNLIIEKLLNLAVSISKMINYVDKISEISGTMMGLLEIDYETKTITTSKRLANFFNIKLKNKNSEIIKLSLTEFEKIKKDILNNDSFESGSTYCFEKNKKKFWFNLFIDKKINQTIVFITDVSNEVKKNNQLDYERKFDLLTGLYTRDTFIDELKRVLNKKNINLGCFITAELNNLKVINDTYGYKIGDEYIKTAAEIISEASQFSIVGKKSGFEFLMFIYGFDTKKEIDNRMELWINKLNKREFIAPDNRKYRIKITAGYCYFPCDALNVDNMLRYSAYALYEAKTLYKGTVHSFSLEEYNREAFIESKVNSLDKLIDENSFKYYFQPIVNLQNASIFGYEALMRTDNNIFSSPREIINIATSENKLYLIEKATVFNCLQIVEDNIEVFKNKKLFYNTIANQILNVDDAKLAISKFEQIGHMLVCEIGGTGSVEENQKTVIKKCSQLRNRRNKVAIDGFGTKFCDTSSLFEINPNYVKFDNSIITDINIKKDKQVLLSKLVRCAKENSVLTVAIGIENKYELETIMKLGIDFAQGYYLGYPKPEFIDELPANVKKEIMEIRMLI